MLERLDKSLVLSQLPDAGLGNKLFCWAHGVIFAANNNLSHYYTGLAKFKLGPILRGERSWRYYKKVFHSFNLLSKNAVDKNEIQISYKKCTDVLERVVPNTIYSFNEVPDWDDYFYALRDNEVIVKKALQLQLHEQVKEKLDKLSSPVIGVHIRMGDFKKLQHHEDFATVGAARTPLQYFIDTIEKIRNTTKTSLPVTIFSDGSAADLQPILQLPNVSIAPKNDDIVEMLHLSKSKIIVLSAGSTFGQWAAYLSSAVVINHYQHFHSYIRSQTVNNQWFEGVLHPNEPITNNLLLQNINSIKAA